MEYKLVCATIERQYIVLMCCFVHWICCIALFYPKHTHFNMCVFMPRAYYSYLLPILATNWEKKHSSPYSFVWAVLTKADFFLLFSNSIDFTMICGLSTNYRLCEQQKKLEYQWNLLIHTRMTYHQDHKNSIFYWTRWFSSGIFSLKFADYLSDQHRGQILRPYANS